MIWAACAWKKSLTNGFTSLETLRQHNPKTVNFSSHLFFPWLWFLWDDATSTDFLLGSSSRRGVVFWRHFSPKTGHRGEVYQTLRRNEVGKATQLLTDNTWFSMSRETHYSQSGNGSNSQVKREKADSQIFAIKLGQIRLFRRVFFGRTGGRLWGVTRLFFPFHIAKTTLVDTVNPPPLLPTKNQ